MFQNKSYNLKKYYLTIDRSSDCYNKFHEFSHIVFSNLDDCRNLFLAITCTYSELYSIFYYIKVEKNV